MSTFDSASGNRTKRPLAVEALRGECTHQGASAEVPGSTSAFAERAPLTERAALRPKGPARVSMATLLNDVLHRRWERGADNCSTRAVADRCKTNPRVIHEYRHGDKLVPWALAYVLPIEVVEEINETIMAERAGGRTWRWALSLVRRGLDWMEQRGAKTADRYEARQALYDAQERITRLLREYDEEGR